MTYEIHAHEPGRAAQVWRECTHRTDASDWFALAVAQFQPDTEIRPIRDGALLARVSVLSPFVKE